MHPGSRSLVHSGAPAEIEQERKNVERQLDRKPTPRKLTENEVKALVAQLRDIVAVLADADPLDKRAIYEELGVKLSHYPGGRVHVAAGAPHVLGVRVGGATSTPSTRTPGRRGWSSREVVAMSRHPSRAPHQLVLAAHPHLEKDRPPGHNPALAISSSGDVLTLKGRANRLGERLPTRRRCRSRSLFPDARGSGRIPPPPPRTHILEEDVGTAIITVELVVVTGGTGGVGIASLVGDTSDQYQSYDTLLAWRLLLDALRPDQAGEVILPGSTLPSWGAALACVGFTCRDAVDRQTTGSPADS